MDATDEGRLPLLLFQASLAVLFEVLAPLVDLAASSILVSSSSSYKYVSGSNLSLFSSLALSSISVHDYALPLPACRSIDWDCRDVGESSTIVEYVQKDSCNRKKSLKKGRGKGVLVRSLQGRPSCRRL